MSEPVFTNGIWENAGNDFWKVMKPGEHLGVVTVNKHDLRYWPRVLTYENYIINYFKTGIYKEVEPTIYLSHFDPVYRQYQEEIEGYVKAVWLSQGFVTEGGLRKPLGIHWSELEDKWFIHPGGTRQAIVYFFAPKKIDCICFNTNAKPVKFKKIFSSIEDIAEYTNSKKVYLSVTKDYDTHIPHVHMDGDTIKPAMVETQARLKKFFRFTKIEANFDLADWGYEESRILKSAKSVVKLTVNDLNRDNIIKALLLLPSFKNYDQGGIKIVRS